MPAIVTLAQDVCLHSAEHIPIHIVKTFNWLRVPLASFSPFPQFPARLCGVCALKHLTVSFQISIRGPASPQSESADTTWRLTVIREWNGSRPHICNSAVFSVWIASERDFTRHCFLNSFFISKLVLGICFFLSGTLPEIDMFFNKRGKSPIVRLTKTDLGFFPKPRSWEQVAEVLFVPLGEWKNNRLFSGHCLFKGSSS